MVMPTKKSKDTIVAAWEIANARYLLGAYTALVTPIRKVAIKTIAAPVYKEDKCPNGCACLVCINNRLDKLLESSEATLNDYRTRLGVNNELANNELQVSSSTDGFDPV